jgi:CRP-like cAMP-binding protein
MLQTPYLHEITTRGRMHQSILQNIAKHVSLNTAEEKYVTSLLVQRQLKKKEPLQLEGQPCDFINYINEGVLRAYYRDENLNESIIMFAVQDWWITDMYSFATHNPAMLNIDALEPSTVLQLSKGDMDKILADLPKLEKFFRILMQNAYIREQLRVIQNLSLPAEQRYKNFLEKYPQFATRVPLKQIASYLGITPEFLSVLRKKFAQGEIS